MTKKKPLPIPQTVSLNNFLISTRHPESYTDVCIGGCDIETQGGLGVRRVFARLRTQPCTVVEGGGLRSLSGFAGHVETLLLLVQLDDGRYRITRAPVMT